MNDLHALPFECRPHEVHVWLAFENDIRSTCLLDEYRTLLNGDERARLANLAFAADRHGYLLTRALARTVLARYTASKPADVLFARDRYRRPILLQNGHAPDLFFSLSRTRGLVLLAVARGRAVGADAENLRRRRAPLHVAREVFSAAELHSLFSLPAGQQSDAFYTGWTVKEACAKATGLGLAQDLRQFEFEASLAKPSAVGLVPTAGSMPDQGFRVWSWQPSGAHRAAVCVNQAAGEPLELYQARLVPLGSGGSLQPLRIGDGEAAQSNMLQSLPLIQNGHRVYSCRSRTHAESVRPENLSQESNASF